MSSSIAAKVERLFQDISSSRFLKRELSGSDIPFFISTYTAAQQVEMQRAVTGLLRRLGNAGVQALEINLYDLVMTVLEREIGLEALFAYEKEASQADFLEAIQSALDMQQVLLPAIEQHVQDSAAQVYLLTGIGEVYPFLRSHTVLNNLHRLVAKAPLVAFFPGTYSGRQLKLFGLLTDDNYYRAFNLDTFTNSST